MLIRITYLFFFIITVTGLCAQTNLVVYHTSGKVAILQGTNSKPALRGDAINKSGTLQLKDASECMLIGANGKSIQLSAAGNYTYEKLQKLLLTSGVTNVSQKYFKYVYDNLFHAPKADVQGVTPVVFRDDRLMKSPVDYSILVSPTCGLSWKKPADKNKVHIQIRNNGIIIYDSTFNTKINQTIINILKLSGSGTFYEWRAEESGVKPGMDVWNRFLIISKENTKEVTAELGLLNNKKWSKDLKVHMKKDLFEKWKNATLK